MGRKELLAWLTQNQDLPQSRLDSLIIYIDKVYEGFGLEDFNNELIGLIRTLNRHCLEQKIKYLSKQLEAADQRKDRGTAEELLREMQLYSEQLAKLK
mgnify:CR=1 FL=1